MTSKYKNESTQVVEFISVTERGGEQVSQAQVDRFMQRYIWAGEIAFGKNVLELACGTGPGLGHLNKKALHLVAADISNEVIAAAREHYGQRIDLRQLDACNTGLDAKTFDVVILFEAIYYLPDVDDFLMEVTRLLRPGGQLLLATANKDLYDFNPSPFSNRYFNPPELSLLLRSHGFDYEFFGGSPVRASGLKNRILRAAKRFAARNRLIPGSMNSKRLLKRIVFGPLVTMPVELDATSANYTAPEPISADKPDTVHQVLYCIATRS
jgi:SAM-dependent methyltransferase